MSEAQSEDQAREHTEQPAEGDRTQDPRDTGTHAQDPAEGADDAQEGSDPT